MDDEVTSAVTILVSFKWWFRAYLMWAQILAKITGNQPELNQWIIARGVKHELVKTL